MSTSEFKQFDAIESLIFNEGVRIASIDIQPELDTMTIHLNTKAILSQKISAYKKLKDADSAFLMKYELIGEGTGIHWPSLDEDLSLKGLLQEALRKIAGK